MRSPRRITRRSSTGRSGSVRERHLPCQFKITYKNDPGQPSTTVTFTGFDNATGVRRHVHGKDTGRLPADQDHAPRDRQRSEGRGGAIRPEPPKPPAPRRRSRPREIPGDSDVQPYQRTGRPLRRTRCLSCSRPSRSAALVMLSTTWSFRPTGASGGSVRQSATPARNAGANRDNNYNRNTNAEPEHQNTNVNRNTRTPT